MHDYHFLLYNNQIFQRCIIERFMMNNSIHVVPGGNSDLVIVFTKIKITQQ